MTDDAADRVTLDESVSYALLTVLEQLACGAHGVRAARRVRLAVRRYRRGGRSHAEAVRSSPRAPVATSSATAALRGLARRARSRRASVRAGGRRGQPRRACRGTRPRCRLDLGRRRARARGQNAAARRGAVARDWAALSRAVHEPIEIDLNGRLGLMLPAATAIARRFVRRQRRPHHPHRRDPQSGKATAPLNEAPRDHTQRVAVRTSGFLE